MQDFLLVVNRGHCCNLLQFWENGLLCTRFKRQTNRRTKRRTGRHTNRQTDWL